MGGDEHTHLDGRILVIPGTRVGLFSWARKTPSAHPQGRVFDLRVSHVGQPGGTMSGVRHGGRRNSRPYDTIA